MNPTFRTAQAGDICILLAPTGQEMEDLRTQQRALQAQFGGRLNGYPHMTSQRFSKPPDHSQAQLLQELGKALSKIKPFSLVAESLTQFYAPFWQFHVLRWRIHRNDALEGLHQVIDSCLLDNGCLPHIDHEMDPSLSALDLDHQVKLEAPLDMEFPKHLFTATQIRISLIKGKREFKNLGDLQFSL